MGEGGWGLTPSPSHLLLKKKKSVDLKEQEVLLADNILSACANCYQYQLHCSLSIKATFTLKAPGA